MSLDGVQILKQVCFTLEKGVILGLVGRSGSGKTTLMNSVLRLEQPNTVYTYSGELLFRRKDQSINLLETHDINSIRRNDVGIIFQQSAEVLNPIMRIKDQIIEKSEKALNTDDLRKIFTEVALEYEQIAHSYPHQLSGGQVQRVLIALALINEPVLILADEPTSSLDKETELSIISLMKRTIEKRGISMLFISHDEELVKRFCEDQLHIDEGQIHKGAPIRGNGLAPEVSPISTAEKELLFEIKHISKSYRQGRIFSTSEVQVFDDFSMNIYKGEFLGIVGKTGAGKSTLAKMLVGMEGCDSGQILFQGELVDRSNEEWLKEYRLTCQYIFQDPASIMAPHRTMDQFISDAIHVGKLNNMDLLSRDVLLDRMDLDSELLHRLPRQLSGGQRQRFAILRVLILGVRVLVCDEILASLDRTVGNEILNLLMDMQQSHGLSIIYISHDQDLLESVADRIINVSS